MIRVSRYDMNWLETVSKAFAKYEPEAMMPTRKCSECMYWIGRSSCKKVRGHINARGWCRFWRRPD